MKRDMDIVRRITLETQKMDSGFSLPGLDGMDQARRELLEELGWHPAQRD